MSLSYEIRQSLKKFILSSYFLKDKYAVEDNIIIFSEARGGSTWLMECLYKIPDVIINWEPLHSKKGVVPESWGNRPYVENEEESDEYFKILKEIFCLQRRNKWTLGRNEFLKFARPKFIILKFVRANLLLPFILDNFHLRKRVIFLLRHPIDTCISQLKAFDYDKKDLLSSYLDNEKKKFSDHLPFLKLLNSNLEVKIAIWCINNIKTINLLPRYKNKIIFVYYKDLVLNPNEEFHKILEKLEIKDSAKVTSLIDFTKASKTSLNSKKIDPERQIWKNINSLSDNEKIAIQKVFDYFDFKLYSAFTPDEKFRF